MNNAIYLQSGGPTAVINSSFYGVIKGCKELNINLYGSLYGIEGLIKDNIVKIDKDLIFYEELKVLNGAALGTCRLKLKDNDERYNNIIDTLNKYNIKYIFLNGGNDSMDTANKLNHYFVNNNIDKIAIGIPKTIDNDLALTDHSPGFGSCIKYIVKTIEEIYLDINSYDKGRVTIVEIMGRDTGWLCASSVCAKLFGLGPDLIYVPESIFEIDKFLNDVKRIYELKGKCLVCVSEALKDKNGEYVSLDKTLDSFGHVQLGSVSKDLCNIIKDRLGFSTRNIELSLPQRSASHLQSKTDKLEAIVVGYNAVRFAVNGKRGMVGIKRTNNIPYQSDFEIMDLDEIANKVKYLPKEYINEDNNYINDSYIEYCLPFLDIDEIGTIDGHMFLKEE